MFTARVGQGLSPVGPVKALPLASLAQCTNRDIISPVGATDSDAWPAAGKGVSIAANSKE